MTGFVEDTHFGGELNALEADLSALLDSKKSNVQSNASKKKNGSSNNGSILMVSENSLVCVMCNQGGFKCAEELGSHIGLCTGGGNMNMVALENKVRQTNVCTTFGNNDEDGENGTNENDESEAVFDDYEIEGADEDEDEDDDDDDFGLHAGKWDGESPFAVADVTQSLKTTLTEEEMLNRYQMMHDDEQIDSDLILETIKYINKSSFLDGAILVFLPGTCN